MNDSEFKQKATDLSNRAINYVKNNPREAFFDVAALVVAFALMDIDDALDSIDDSTALSAAVDYSTYAR
tara:strand:- start:142 stop:348 length:207 start_codon:yes stop_codon:yes gene_type:complete